MNEKKEHWWTKLKEKWQNTDEHTKNCVKCWAIGLATGGIVGGATVGSIVSMKANQDIAQITEDACSEAIKAYDQGVFDGAMDPEGSLYSLKKLGKL